MVQSYKVSSIETLRGIAILLVIIGHVIGSAPDGGMKIDFPSPWRYLYLWIDYIQMPLFTAIAGWVYALKPVQKNAIKVFFRKKIFRLLLPMAVAGTLYFIVQYIVPGTNSKSNLSDIWKIYIFPYTIYWYLPSLFIMFIFIAIIDIKQWASQIKGWVICMLIAYLGLIAEKEIIPYSFPNLFSFKGALSQFPYFLIGVGINRFSKELFTVPLKRAYILFSILGIILLQLEWFYHLSQNNIYEILQPLWVIALLFILLHQTFSSRIFVWLGSYAYIIYLYHGFGTSGGRIILSHIGIHSEMTVFLFATAIAILLPVLIAKVAQKCKFIHFLVLGIK